MSVPDPKPTPVQIALGIACYTESDIYARDETRYNFHIHHHILQPVCSSLHLTNAGSRPSLEEGQVLRSPICSMHVSSAYNLYHVILSWRLCSRKFYYWLDYGYIHSGELSLLQSDPSVYGPTRS